MQFNRQCTRPIVCVSRYWTWDAACKLQLSQAVNCFNQEEFRRYCLLAL